MAAGKHHLPTLLTTVFIVVIHKPLPDVECLVKKSNSCSFRKPCRNFLSSHRGTLDDICQRRAIHDSGDIIARVQKYPAKTADGFLRAAMVTGNRNAINRGQNTVKMTHHLAHGDLVGVPGKDISATDTGHAIHPALRLEREHNLLKKPLRHIIASGQFTDGDGQSTIMIHEREHGAQSIICSF